MIAAATEGRNCVAVEENPILYIYSKVHVVNAGVGIEQKQQRQFDKQRDDTPDTLESRQTDNSVNSAQTQQYQN